MAPNTAPSCRNQRGADDLASTSGVFMHLLFKLAVRGIGTGPSSIYLVQGRRPMAALVWSSAPRSRRAANRAPESDPFTVFVGVLNGRQEFSSDVSRPAQPWVSG